LLSQMCESGIRAHVCYDFLIFFIRFDRMGVDFFRHGARVSMDLGEKARLFSINAANREYSGWLVGNMETIDLALSFIKFLGAYLCVYVCCWLVFFLGIYCT